MIRRYYTAAIFIYTLFLLYMMFFGLGRHSSDLRFLQLHPFQTITHFFGPHINRQAFLINIVGNVFVFSPFGLLGLILKKLNRIKFLSLSFLLCICIVEFAQYITGRGTADIDDVILNTTGMLLGFGLLQASAQFNWFNISIYLPKKERNIVSSY
ncbi:VanZ family protein [Halpernia frigidisoli]|uniref:VanZ like family protein n=1 Tax=Halpernia frigidisoli TaxID=1125876 RepID=A0A1I3J8V6_9FLAO|nr:VanZ family protein [Halpernia frigidisoli]SFI56754.1 VanZ like family protein [Halpernia frigidisoli]